MGYFTSIVGALLAACAVNAIQTSNPRSSLLTANSPVPLYSDAAPAQVRASRGAGAWLHPHYISSAETLRDQGHPLVVSRCWHRAGILSGPGGPRATAARPARGPCRVAALRGCVKGRKEVVVGSADTHVTLPAPPPVF